MSTASKLGAAFGAGLLGFMLLGSPAMAGPNGEKKDNGSEATMNDAAPGGADREVESGGSGTQGRSHSNPDGGGVDKPYAAAGQDAESQGDSDYDGNNGCGNDTDFADDNNGNCGGLKKGHDKPAGEVDGDTDVNTPVGNFDDNTTTPAPSVTYTSAEVAGNTVTNTAASSAAPTVATAAATTAATTASPQGATVLGIQFERVAASGAVASTSAAAPAPAGASVLGLQLERGAPAALARTGLPLAVLALLAVGLILGGIAARRTARS